MGLELVQELLLAPSLLQSPDSNIELGDRRQSARPGRVVVEVRGESIALADGAQQRVHLVAPPLPRVPRDNLVPAGVQQRKRVDRLHGLAEGAADLEQVGHAVHVGADVLARGVEQRRVEEDAVADLHGQRDVVLVEVVDELLAPVGHVPLLEGLREREQPRRPALGRDVDVRHGALQREELAGDVHRPRDLGGPLGRLEPQVVVAVADLGLGAGAYVVHLRRDAVAPAQPGRGNKPQERVRVVLSKRPRVREGVLAERVPDAVVAPRGGEVVALRDAPRALALDDGVEGPVGPLEDGPVAEEALGHEHAGPAVQHAVPLVLQGGALRGAHGGEGGWQGVDGHVVVDCRREGVLLARRVLRADGGEVVQGGRLFEGEEAPHGTRCPRGRIPHHLLCCCCCCCGCHGVVDMLFFDGDSSIIFNGRGEDRFDICMPWTSHRGCPWAGVLVDLILFGPHLLLLGCCWLPHLVSTLGPGPVLRGAVRLLIDLGALRRLQPAIRSLDDARTTVCGFAILSCSQLKMVMVS